MGTGDELIEARNVTRWIGPRFAVHDLSFVAARGSLTGLLGENGAGKTTTLRLLAGVLLPDTGSIRIAGRCTEADGTAARAHIGYLPEAAGGFHQLNARDLLTYAAEARGIEGRAAAREVDRVAALVGIEARLHQTLATLSKGWRQRAWLGQALVGDPPVLLLDEPTDGLDPIQKSALRALLRSLAAGKAIVLSTHILEEAEALCDTVILMSAGAIVAQAPLPSLLDERGRLEPAFRAQMRPHPAPA